MFKILLMYPRGFNFIKTVYKLFDNPLYMYICIYANTHLLCTILERDMMSIFPNCVKNVRVHALSDSVKFSRRPLQKILDLLSWDLTTSKDKSYRTESSW